MWPFTKTKPPEVPAVTNAASVSVFERTRDPVRDWYRGEGLADLTLSLADVKSCSNYVAAVDLIAEVTGSLPWHVFQAGADNSRALAANHPYSALLRQPAPGMTRIEWTEMAVRGLCYHGNAYCLIQREGTRITGLPPLDPGKMTVVQVAQGRPGYRYEKQIFTVDEVAHWRWRSTDGLVGIPPWQDGQRTVGLAIAEELYAAVYFRSGTTIGGIVEAPLETGTLSAEARRLLLDQFNAAHQGVQKAHQTAFLDGGMSYRPLGSTSEQAQLVESRQLSVAAVCRMFRLPPSLLADFSRATWANSSESLRMLGMIVLSPLAVRLAATLNLVLFPESPSRFYTEISLDGLMRGSPAERGEFLGRMVTSGIMTANEARKLENLPEHPDGDQLAASGPVAPLESTVNVAPAQISVESPPVTVNLTVPPRGQVERVVAETNDDGFPVKVIEREVEDGSGPE